MEEVTTVEPVVEVPSVSTSTLLNKNNMGVPTIDISTIQSTHVDKGYYVSGTSESNIKITVNSTDYYIVPLVNLFGKQSLHPKQQYNQLMS